VTLTICSDNSEELTQIEKMLQEICGGILVNRATQQAYFTPYDYSSEGCSCLRKIIESKREVHIHPLQGPKEKVPGSSPAPGKPDKSIGSCTGGCTVPSPTADAYETAPGTAGPGADTDVFIDMSNNDQHGYKAPEGSGSRKPQLWLILAHELTGGHASHCIDGTVPFTTGDEKIDKANRENQAILSENKIRTAHGWHLRRYLKSGEEEDE
jgi:hypothetical protein